MKKLIFIMLVIFATNVNAQGVEGYIPRTLDENHNEHITTSPGFRNFAAKTKEAQKRKKLDAKQKLDDEEARKALPMCQGTPVKQKDGSFVCKRKKN